MSIYDKFDKAQINILKQRAARLAAMSEESDSDIIRSALTLTIWGEKYAFPIESLTAVYEKINVVDVPCTPSHIGGIANIRGRIIPVLELGILLEVPVDNVSNEISNLVVASDNETMIAFRVEKIGDVLTFYESDIEQNDTNPYLEGLLNDGTALLNMRTILNDPNLIVNETVV